MSRSLTRIRACRHLVVSSMCCLALGAALAVQPATAKEHGRTSHGTPAAAAMPVGKDCPLESSSLIKGLLSQSGNSSRRATRHRLGIFGKIYCLGRCAGECGAKAHTCIFRPTPGAIFTCFAIRCGPRGVKCARKCL